MFISYPRNNDGAARWLIARGLGGHIYISSGKFLKNGTRYSSLGVCFELKYEFLT